MSTESLRAAVENQLGEPVDSITSVSGGSINEAGSLKTAEGNRYFLKWNRSAPYDMFAKEATGLELLRSAQSGLRVPVVICTGSAGDGTYFIVMEHIAEGTAGTDSHRSFGQQLAQLHRQTMAQYGLSHDNYIGRLPQSNKPHDHWINFLINERFKPQLKMALDARKLSADTQSHFENLFKKMPDILAEEPASLLHGDLWSGNYLFDENGQPAIYDPAAYYGNREIEIAMTHLFGGFSSGFYDAYNETYPLKPNFNERKEIYNLYPLLVHTNLFGGSYGQRVQNIVERFS